MTTYLEQALDVADRNTSAYVAALGALFDDRIKETRVVETADLYAFTESCNDAARRADVSRLDSLVSRYLAEGKHFPVAERDARSEAGADIMHVVACQSGEAVIAANNELLPRFYNFDLWHSPNDRTWLAARYADGIAALGERVEFDSVLFVAKRLGPLGPLTMMDRLGLKVPAYVLNLRSNAFLGDPSLLQHQRICVIYDLVHSGHGMQEIADRCAAVGARAVGAVVLYRYPGAPAPHGVDVTSIMQPGPTRGDQRPLDPEAAAAILKEHFATVSPREFWERASRASNGDILPPQ